MIRSDKYLTLAGQLCFVAAAVGAGCNKPSGVVEGQSTATSDDPNATSMSVATTSETPAPDVESDVVNTDATDTTGAVAQLGGTCLAYGERQAECNDVDAEEASRFCQSKFDDADGDECQDAFDSQFRCLAEAECEQWSEPSLCEDEINEVDFVCNGFEDWTPIEVPEMCEALGEKMGECHKDAFPEGEVEYYGYILSYICANEVYYEDYYSNPTEGGGPSANKSPLLSTLDIGNRRSAEVQQRGDEGDEYSFYEYDCPGATDLLECLSTLDCAALDEKQGCDNEVETVFAGCGEKSPQLCKNYALNSAFCGAGITVPLVWCSAAFYEIESDFAGDPEGESACREAMTTFFQCTADMSCDVFFSGETCIDEEAAKNDECYPPLILADPQSDTTVGDTGGGDTAGDVAQP